MEADGYHKIVHSINLSQVFVNSILAVFTASVARMPHTFQCCAAQQHKSSAAMNEHLYKYRKFFYDSPSEDSERPSH